jgi:hypothetical protein
MAAEIVREALPDPTVGQIDFLRRCFGSTAVAAKRL